MQEAILITQIGFDYLENHSPIYMEPVGFCSTRAMADKVKARLDAKAHHYQGYNGCIYPQYVITCIPNLDGM